MTACMLISAFALSMPVAGVDDEALAQARERIQRIRTAEVTLRVTDGNKPLPEGTEIEVQQTRHAFLFGANIFLLGRCDTPEQNAAYEQAFAGLFNYATLPFYWWKYETEPGKLADDRTEQLLKWCSDHGITCKGHPLAWNWVDPAWLPASPLEAIKLQFERIEKTTRQWAGRIDLWDVVNEATAFDRDQPRQNAPKLTEAIKETGVQNYLRQAFAAARRGRPKARLIINDYITSPEYATNVIDKLTDEKGQPLYDVIGIQCHQHAGVWSAAQIWEICERFAKYGKLLHFTEATILSGEHGWELPATRPAYDWKSTPEGEAQQAREVIQFYTMLFSHPAVEAITWWDFCDQHAWQAAPAGLLRRDATPKPAYEQLHKLVKGEWWTTTRVRVGTDGLVKLRGFYGEYELNPVSTGDHPMTGRFTLSRDNKGVVPVSLKIVPLR